jgi:XTP/dITP diphosphohydrolase
MRLIIASNNAHKIIEIKDILKVYFNEIYSLGEAGLSIEVEEDGDTFAKNAIKKADEVLKAAPGFNAALADDSGIVVDALGGAPGVYSARYAGEGHNSDDNNQKLLCNMQSVPDEKRTCRFVSAVALARRGQKTVCAEGACEGLVMRECAGEGGFGYDSLFYYAPMGRSFAQLTAREKNSVSHRKRALMALRAYLDAEKI